MPNHYDILIIGGGISGLTAGIYAARSGQRTFIIQGGYNSSTDMPGGQLLLTNEIDNFPGFKGSGADLIEIVQQQAEEAGCEMVEENAVDFYFSSTSHLPHLVRTESGEEYTASSVILATGAVARRLGIEGEDEYFGRGVSTCATCDGAFFKDKTVVVVGGGDTAVEDALYLSNIAKKVIMVHRRERFRTDSPESRSLIARKNVEVRWNSVIESIAGSNTVESVRFRHLLAGHTYAEPIDGVFVAVGHDPATKHFKGASVSLSKGGYIKVDDTLTSLPGVFAAGDVADPVYRQAITAAATGAQAAMNSIKYNEQFERESHGQ